MIYLDNAASAPVDPRALKAAEPFLCGCCGNPSSSHSEGRKAALAVIKARGQCAAALGAFPDEIVFTSGGTESDNMAVMAARLAGGRRVVTSAVEHPAVKNACAALEKSGFEVVRLMPDSDGIISVKSAQAAITPDTALVSIMTANNEIGTIQPIREIGEICRARGVMFHTDAVQAAGSIPLDVNELCCDMLSVSAHKIGGLKGGGLLYVRRGTPIAPLMFGGGQERGLRPGTENTAAIAALGEAFELAAENIPEKQRRISGFRDELIKRLLEIPDSYLNGSADKRLCGNVNVSFSGVEGEALVLNLDLAGICASSGSACASGSPEPSYVIKALGLSDERARGSLRLTLSERTDRDEILTAAAVVRECVERLRALTAGGAE